MDRKPIVGEVVHYYGGSKGRYFEEGPVVGPKAAIVTGFTEDGNLMLYVIPSAPSAGPFYQTASFSKEPKPRTWTWPPTRTT